MGSQECNTMFDRIYNQTYKQAMRYVTARCGDPGDISDILQEIYAELYRVLLKKGTAYIQNPEAFVMQLAKSKVYKHYSFREKLLNAFPFAAVQQDKENDAQEEIGPMDNEPELEDLVADRILLRKIADHIKTKPADVQRIFFLYFVLEQTSAQIALDLHINESTVKSKIHRTVHEVRDLYGKVGKEI